MKWGDLVIAIWIILLVAAIATIIVGCGGGGGGGIPYANTQQQAAPGTKDCQVVLSKADGGTGACIPLN